MFFEEKAGHKSTFSQCPTSYTFITPVTMATADRQKLKHSYQEIIETVRSVINEWDPYDLIKGGAPDNEFVHEVALIAAKANEVKTPAELAEVISKIFSTSFGPEWFSVTACTPIAYRLFTELQTSVILEYKKP